MVLKKFDLHGLTKGVSAAIWLSPEHHSNLTKIVARGGDLFNKLIIERDLKALDPADFYAALAMSGGHFANDSDRVGNIDGLGGWSRTEQNHGFWEALNQLLTTGRSSFESHWAELGGAFDVPESVCPFSASDVEDKSSPDHGFRFKPLQYVPYDYRTDPTPAPTATQAAGAAATQSTTGVSKMSTIIATNKTALIAAAQLKAGSALNAAVVAALKKSGAVPMMLRGYLDSPLASVVVANVVNVAAGYTTNAKVKQAAQLMLQSAAVDVVNLVDIEGMISKLIDSPDIAKALAGVTEIDE
jgi:hypothetical protein